MWFKCNPSDWLKRWPERSLEHFGTFCTLLTIAWDRQGIPDDITQVSKLTGLPEQTLEPAWETFKTYCAPYDGQLLPLEMIDGIADYKARIEQRKAAGKASAQAKEQRAVNGPLNEPSTSRPTDKIRVDKRRERKSAPAARPASRKSEEKAPKPPAETKPEHVAIVSYKQIIHLTPNEIQREMIEYAVTDDAAWRQVLREWMGHGWSPKNVDGMLDLYRQKAPERPPDSPALPHPDCELCHGEMSYVAVINGERTLIPCESCWAASEQSQPVGAIA